MMQDESSWSVNTGSLLCMCVCMIVSEEDTTDVPAIPEIPNEDETFVKLTTELTVSCIGHTVCAESASLTSHVWQFSLSEW